MGLSDKIKNAKEGASLFEDVPADRKYALTLQAQIAVSIFNARKARGMTQADFAKLCGVTQAMVSKWESGDNNFSITAWAELAHRLSLPFDPSPAATRISGHDGYTGMHSSADTYQVAASKVIKFAPNRASCYHMPKEN